MGFGTSSNDPVIWQLELSTWRVIRYLSWHRIPMHWIKIIHRHLIIWAIVKRSLFHWIQLCLYPFVIEMVHAWILTILQDQLARSSFFHILKQFWLLGFCNLEVFLFYISSKNITCLNSSVVLAKGSSIHLEFLKFLLDDTGSFRKVGWWCHVGRSSRGKIVIQSSRFVKTK